MSWHQERNTFESNVRSVLELLDFDREIIQLVAEGLRSVAKELEHRHSLHSTVRCIAMTLCCSMRPMLNVTDSCMRIQCGTVIKMQH
jgi:hypothetical protein